MHFFPQCRWEEGAIWEWSAVTYPDKLPEYIEQEFRKLKRKQAELLGIKSSSHGGPSGGGSGGIKKPEGVEKVEVQDVNVVKDRSKLSVLAAKSKL